MENSTPLLLTDIGLFSEVTVNVAGILKSDYAESTVILAKQTQNFAPEHSFYINFAYESAIYTIGQSQYLSCGQYITLDSAEGAAGYSLSLHDDNYMLADGSAVRFVYEKKELFDNFYALDISDLSKVDCRQ